jgi:hypothetical protein
VLWELNTPFSIEEIEVAPPKAKEVRIKVRKGLGVHKPIMRSHLYGENHCYDIRFLNKELFDKFGY